jgi:hypothetical protein
MAAFIPVCSFNAGELSPRMISRTDVAQYSKGCKTLRNFFVTPYGSVERRPGTFFIDYANNENSRLIPFVFSNSVAFVCEFGEYTIRFFRENKFVGMIDSPYTALEAAALKFVKCGDIMTLCHPEHPVRELRRIGDSAFEIVEKEYQFPPMLAANNDDDFTLTPSGVDGDITLTSSRALFDASSVGAYFQLVHTRKENEIKKDFTADGVSEGLEVFGYWTFTTHGTWTGNIVIQRSFDNGKTWYDYRTYSSSRDANFSESGSETIENTLYRVKMSDYEAATSGTLNLCRMLFVNADFVTNGVVRITSVDSDTSAGAKVVRKLGEASATAEWSEGAWSAKRGYPRAVSFFEERMIFGGTRHQPQTIWGSKVGDWDNFLPGANDADPIEFTLASDSVNSILWMCQHNALVIGTNDSEWTLFASDYSSAVTPTNYRLRRQSMYGATDVQAVMVGSTMLFIQRGGRKIREFVYSAETDAFSCPDLTILAEHITNSGVKEAVLQQQPDSIFWCVLANGTLAALTYERDQQVVGWHRHDTQGEVRSVAVTPSGDGYAVYFIVKRKNGCFIEVMAERNADMANVCFSDASIRISSDQEMEEVEGLEHLAGQKVCILADGAIQEERTVNDSGKIILDVPAKNVCIGLPFVSELELMPLEADMQNGSSQLRKKALGSVKVAFYNSIGGEIKVGEAPWESVVSRDVLLDNMDEAVKPKDDIITIHGMAGYLPRTVIKVRQSDPLPLNVISVVAAVEVAEK